MAKKNSNAREHYWDFLAGYYTWIFGGGRQNSAKYVDYFKKRQIAPRLGGRALDLGCGNGAQSFALCELGFHVIGIDSCQALLDELMAAKGESRVEVVNGDMLDFQRFSSAVELIVCMGDTINHLGTFHEAGLLLSRIYEGLEPGGRAVLEFRDNTRELKGVDRIIPLKSDETRIATAFLEYEGDFLNVNDTMYARKGPSSPWTLEKSSYRKLRLGEEWVVGALKRCGFKMLWHGQEEGLINVVAEKKKL